MADIGQLMLLLLDAQSFLEFALCVQLLGVFDVHCTSGGEVVGSWAICISLGPLLYDELVVVILDEDIAGAVPEVASDHFAPSA